MSRIYVPWQDDSYGRARPALLRDLTCPAPSDLVVVTDGAIGLP